MVEYKSLPDRVAGIYYSHGVWCAAHPVPVILAAVCIVLLSCVPLINLPLPGNIPQVYAAPLNSSEPDSPRWLSDKPVYVQQVVLKSAVSPWTQDMLLTDAIRAPLAEVFRLLEAIQNFKLADGISLTDVCSRVETPTRPLPLPQYNCLIVSPADFWRRDPSQFFTDVNLVSTVYGSASVQIGKSNLPELLFGVNLKEGGFKRYPVRTRQRVLQYAVSIFYDEYHPKFVEGLNEYLSSLYPSTNSSVPVKSLDPVHVYHRGDFDFHEFLPLFFTYLILFFYMYFSVRKIPLVRSKVGMALSAVFTVLASLIMSTSLCLFFGFDPAGSSRGREVFPYLVVVVGLENVLVLTKSVVSTPSHLDAKIRVAQGLSKEGWSITKNLLTELTILTIGLFTLVPSIQEFCIFAMVGLLCDFFLQMCFFSTVLSLDMRGFEESDFPRALRSLSRSGLLLSGPSDEPLPRQPIPRSRSVPRLDTTGTEESSRVPKRLQLVLFWGRTRIVQRAFMLCMVAWIGGFVYSAGIVQHLVPSVPEGEVRKLPPGHILGRYRSLLGKQGEATILGHSFKNGSESNNDDVLNGVKDTSVISPVKWCYLLNLYNSSTSCRLTLLPPVRISCLVPPWRASALRNPLEPPRPPLQWSSLARALDPEDETQSESSYPSWEAPYLPTSPFEVLLVTGLCVISILVMAYTALALYNCVCSRNYAQWRSAWSETDDSSESTSQVVLQAVPLVLEGQGQCVEWLASDGSTVSCSYLSGDVNVWDSSSGERLAHIDRKNFFSQKSLKTEPITEPSNEHQIWNLRHRNPVYSNFPDLSKVINVKFSDLSSVPPTDSHRSGFDYGPTIRMLYLDECELECDEDNEESLFDGCPSIWCMDSADNLIALGTSSGRLEFWEATTGKLKGLIEESTSAGVTCIKMVSSRVVVARLNGTLEVYTLEWTSVSGSSSIYRRSHCRAASFGSHPPTPSVGSDLIISKGRAVRAHQQPISVLDAKAGRILTGSRDHTLKVFSLVDELLVFTLHGHCGPLTALFIDSSNPLMAGSGSADGMVCVWDLLTGACVYSLNAHDGAVTALTYSSSYVLSLGADERLCVWDRFQGHLLNTVQLVQAYCTSMAMLTHNLLITSKQGSLVIYDVRSGEPVRLVKLGHADGATYVSTILPLRDSVACDYGHSLRIVRFPLVRDKID